MSLVEREAYRIMEESLEGDKHVDLLFSETPGPNTIEHIIVAVMRYMFDSVEYITANDLSFLFKVMPGGKIYKVKILENMTTDLYDKFCYDLATLLSSTL